MAESPLELLKGTLDLLILSTVSLAPLHGYGISLSIREATNDAFQVVEGALYPALRRLEKKGLLEAEWKTTGTGREAKFYRLTPDGEAELAKGRGIWSRYVEAMAQVLGAPAGG